MGAGKCARLTIRIEVLIVCNNEAKDSELLSWPNMLTSATLSTPPTSVYFLCLLSLPHIKFRKPPVVISLLCFPKSGNLQILRTKLEPQDDNFIWKLNPAIEVIWENKKYIWERKKKQPWGRNLIMVNQSFLVANLPECMLML